MNRPLFPVLFLSVFVLAGFVFAPPLHGRDLRWVRSFTYVLQDIDINELGASDFDLVVMDYSSDGTEAGEFSPADIDVVRGGDKVVLAYLSIGEAESYRFYWKSWWRPGNPSWLGPENPDWPGNYRVKYWDPAWQAIVLEYLDRIIGQGFDGIYMDIVDGYEYWENHGRPGARADMTAWIGTLADHARKTHGLADFYLIAQNGEELADHEAAYSADYFAAVDGIGRESVFYEGNTPNPRAERLWVSGFLDQVLLEGKLVMTVDYCTGQNRIDHVYASSAERGWVPYVTVVDLDEMTVNPGHEPPPGPPPAEAWRYIAPSRVIDRKGASGGPLAAIMGRDSEGTFYGDTMVFSKTYAGVVAFSLPADLDPADILDLEALIGYAGPGSAEQEWKYGLYSFAGKKWAYIGNNSSAVPWEFTPFLFTPPGSPAQYTNGNLFAAGMASGGNKDVCEIDFFALRARYRR